MTDLKTLYETDTAAWSEQQAAALRGVARGGSNQPLDWENLAEEIEDSAESLRRRLRGQIARIIQHQVKLEYSPAIHPRNGWRRTIRLARLDIDRILEDSPSLKREIPRLIEKEAAGLFSSQFSIWRSTAKSTRWNRRRSEILPIPRSRYWVIGSRKSRRGKVVGA
jgi:hypothetical protein